MSGEGIHGKDCVPLPSDKADQSSENQENRFRARPFLFRRSDLDIDFGEKFRPVLITRLLASGLDHPGGTGFSEQEIWHWSIKERLQGLIAIVVSTQGQQLRLQFGCNKTDCHELMEVELDLELFNRNDPPIPLLCRPDSDTELILRLPNGLDQLNWKSKPYTTAENLFSEMASSLVCRINGETPAPDFRVPKEWFDQISSVLEQNDDLITLEINTCCPACGEDLVIDFDLEGKLLEVLLSEQKLMLKHIHNLARVYHWSESDIMAIPNERRQYYLAQIDQEAIS